LSAIVPAEVSFRDGALYSEQFGDVYFSLAGALEESRHVFLRGNGLPARFGDQPVFTIAELGFGCGLNFLATCQAWGAHAGAGARLHFISVEKHPFRKTDLARVHEAWPQLRDWSQALLVDYPPLLPGFHRLHLHGGRIALTLLFGEASQLLPELEARADAFFLDGFAPAKNPQMWTPALFVELRRLAARGATAASYSVAGAVRRALSQAGFTVEKRPGFGRKREMLIARIDRGTAGDRPRSRTAVVVGAGIAGASCALALARCGFDVQVLEAARQPAQGASANPAGLVRPFVTLERGARDRFSWAAFGYAVRHYAALSAIDPALWARSGVLQLARDAAHLRKLERALAELRLPAELARPVDSKEGARLCGAPVAGAGVWLGEAGWLRAARACAATFSCAGPRVQLRTGATVAVLDRRDGMVVVRDAAGGVLAESPHVVLANGYRAAALDAGNRLALRAVRGQVSLLPACLPSLRAPVCREGYVTPAFDGAHVVGATYQEEAKQTAARAEDHAANLARARSMLPGAFVDVDAGSLRSWVGLRCVSRDRRPVLGELSPGIHACLALGSRGFTWAPLAAELVACMIAQAPWPIERRVATALSPSRFFPSER
jgi:tRNA 5-methylaminomethyl-2-thiouridine biosynthesis bifunctional protein